MTKKSKKKPEVPVVEPQNAAKATAEGMVVGTEPVATPVPTVMAEAIDPMAENRRAVKEDTKGKIMAMLDQYMFQVKPQLEAMVASGEIGNYTVLKHGQSFAGDYKSDRVQIYIHGQGEKITDIQVG